MCAIAASCDLVILRLLSQLLNNDDDDAKRRRVLPTIAGKFGGVHKCNDLYLHDGHK